MPFFCYYLYIFVISNNFIEMENFYLLYAAVSGYLSIYTMIQEHFDKGKINWEEISIITQARDGTIVL